MKKLIIALSVALALVFTMAFAISAETIEVTDDGTTEITLGDCVIEGLDRKIPQPSSGFTYQLDTETKTAKITKWANMGDAENGVSFVIPSTVIYNGETYSVTAFDRVTNKDKVLELIAIPDTVTAIPAYAFDSCGDVRYIYVGSGVETIGNNSFQWVGFAGDKSLVDENGEKIGNIRDFIWKTQKITTLTSCCFFHLDFNPDCVIEFPFEKITTFESACMAYNPYALTADHDIGRQLYLDVFDLRNATSIASDAFANSAIAQTIIVRADQVNLLSPQKLRGGGSSQPENDNTFVIYGGDTAETAVTLNGSIWIANTWYWLPCNVHFNIVFRGYVNAYDGTDGLENQNGYGNDIVDYIFESEDTFRHYINSVDTTTNRATTYTRYAKNTKGYFNVCVNTDGTHSFKAYNLAYTPASEGVEESVVISEIQGTSLRYGNPTRNTILDDDCTSSNLCFVCDFIFTKGLEHEIGTTYEYANGYTNNGLKVVGCTRCLKGEETVLEPLFTSFGYSKDETGVGIVHKVNVNKEAITTYESLLSEQKGEAVTIKYGVVAAIAEDGCMPITSEGKLAEGYRAVVAEINGTNYQYLQIKLSGITELDMGLNCNAYVVVDANVYYINGNETSDKAKVVTYNGL